MDFIRHLEAGAAPPLLRKTFFHEERGVTPHMADKHAFVSLLLEAPSRE